MSTCVSDCAIRAGGSSTARTHASATAGAHSVGQLSFRDKQLYWYGNMLRYARKHFSSGQVFLLRLAIIKGMVLRSIGALFGARKAPLGGTLSAYGAVLSHAFKSGELRT